MKQAANDTSDQNYSQTKTNNQRQTAAELKHGTEGLFVFFFFFDRHVSCTLKTLNSKSKPCADSTQVLPPIRAELEL